jgi:hypothetical protein
METLNEKPTFKTTTSEPRLSFNEWSEQLKVSSNYIEPTKYFQGNPSSGIPPMKETKNFVERFMELFSSNR